NDTTDQPVIMNIISATAAAHGSIDVAPGGVVYRPNFGYHGPDSFDYTVSDGVSTATATVSITVAGVGLDKDPANPAGGDTALVLLGTDGNDNLRFSDDGSSIRALINGVDTGQSWFKSSLT